MYVSTRVLGTFGYFDPEYTAVCISLSNPFTNTHATFFLGKISLNGKIQYIWEEISTPVNQNNHQQLPQNTPF